MNIFVRFHIICIQKANTSRKNNWNSKNTLLYLANIYALFMLLARLVQNLSSKYIPNSL